MILKDPIVPMDRETALAGQRRLVRERGLWYTNVRDMITAPDQEGQIGRLLRVGKWQEAEKLFIACGMHEGAGGGSFYAHILATAVILGGEQTVTPYWDRPQAEQDALLNQPRQKMGQDLKESLFYRDMARKWAVLVVNRHYPVGVGGEELLSATGIKGFIVALDHLTMEVDKADMPSQEEDWALLTQKLIKVVADAVRPLGFEPVDNLREEAPDYGVALARFMRENPPQNRV